MDQTSSESRPRLLVQEFQENLDFIMVGIDTGPPIPPQKCLSSVTSTHVPRSVQDVDALFQELLDQKRDGLISAIDYLTMARKLRQEQQLCSLDVVVCSPVVVDVLC